MNGTNEAWLAALRSPGPDQDEALASLRRILLSGLRKSFHGQAGIDDPLLEDITQDALLKTLGALGQFQGKSRFTTWATAIAVRVAYTELRRRKWKDVSLDQLVHEAAARDGLLADPAARPGARLEQASLIQTMYRIIDGELSEKQRAALLAELKGMPLEEIGRRLGSNRNAVYKLTHDARRRLKRGLEAAGYSVADLQTA